MAFTNYYAALSLEGYITYYTLSDYLSIKPVQYLHFKNKTL